MADYIIREDAYMALTGDITDCTIEEFIARLRDKLSKLPSVSQAVVNNSQGLVKDLVKGTWNMEDEEYIYRCDKCGFEIDAEVCIDPIDYINTYKFCPNCGNPKTEVEDDDKRSL